MAILKQAETGITVSKLGAKRHFTCQQNGHTYVELPDRMERAATT
ncbi:hypothetical protein [Nitrosomonas sp. PY1]|nr:hypothetical protein [Nitrosomonas sp. PY1]